MKKGILLLVLTSLLVSCGDTPESACREIVSSQERVADILASDGSVAEKKEVVTHEIETLEKLRKKVCSSTWSRKEFCQGVTACEKDARVEAIGKTFTFYRQKTTDESLRELLREYAAAGREFRRELAKSCNME